MPTGLTQQQVVNSALEMIATQSRITSLADGSPEANAASVIYVPTVELMLRAMEPDFARYTATLAMAKTPSQVPPWAFEYAYPADCIRLRQVRPPTNGITDINDPQPVLWNVAFDIISAVNTKVILANLPNALAVYTTSTVTEAQWDATFTDSIVRRLANPLAMALSGRPDFARELLDEASKSAAMSEMVDESAMRRGG